MLEILSITGPIFLIIALGFAAVRSGVFAKSNVRALGLFVIHFALPALLFNALSQRAVTEIVNTPYLLAYAAGSLAMLALGIGIARLVQHRDLPASAITGMGMSFSNSAFIGYPVALQLVGPTASVALALTMIIENLLMIPLVLALAESRGNSSQRPWTAVATALARLLRNPIILAIIAGVASAMLRLRLPEPLARTIDMLAMASAPVSLFVIGGTLVGLKTKGMALDAGLIVTGKLLLHPAAVFIALLLLPPIDPALQLAALILACAPMLSIYPIIGQKYAQEERCAAALVAATVASFITISILVWIIRANGLLPVA